MAKDQFYWHDFIQIPAPVSNLIRIKMLDEITYPFPHFNGGTAEVWEWMRKFIAHFNMDVWLVLSYIYYAYAFAMPISLHGHVIVQF